MMQFECSICTFSHEVFNRKVHSITCSTMQDGQITILPHHENAMLLLTPGRLAVNIRADIEAHAVHNIKDKNAAENMRVFLHGSGYIQVQNGAVLVFAFPIFAEGSLSKEAQSQMRDLGDYGAKCLEAWKSQ